MPATDTATSTVSPAAPVALPTVNVRPSATGGSTTPDSTVIAPLTSEYATFSKSSLYTSSGSSFTTDNASA